MHSRIKDPVSALTHLLGAILSIFGLIILLYYAAIYATTWHIVSFSIFGISMILLYVASTTYHWLKTSEDKVLILRKIDHMMIYVLIAGTYTPICIIVLKGIWGWGLLIGIWTFTLAGILLKVFWFDAPRWLYTLSYTLMGWLVVIAIVPLYQAISLVALIWLVLGGVLYTIGALIYGTKWPRVNSEVFGFHEIFHLFILGGSFCHFYFMLRYVLFT